MVVILPVGWSDFEISECCTDSSERGQRILIEELRFTNQNTVGGNNRTSWGYISPTEDVYTLVGNASCAGGNMTYPSCCQINHFMGPGGPVNTIPPFGLLDNWPAINCIIGTSDEPVFSFTNSTFRRAYFPLRNASADFDSPPVPGPPFGNFFNFAKEGNNFYGFNAIRGGAEAVHRIWAWNMGGAFLWESVDLLNYNQVNPCVTANFIYAIIDRATGTTAPVHGLAKLSRTDGALIGTFNLDNIGAAAMAVVNDNLIYIFTSNGALYYLKNFNTLIFVGRCPATISPFGVSGFYTNGKFYYGGMGFSGFSTNIFSMNLPCPEGAPLIATVSTATNTVAHGANILVNWDDVLEPHITDKLYLKANDGLLFTASPLSNQGPGTGAGDGSFSFPIPGGTAPGSYVIQFVAKNNYLVATSAPFTVT